MEVGAIIADRYRLTDEYAPGADHLWFRAHDDILDRAVSIKVWQDETRKDVLRREARLSARVVHPNFLTVHDLQSSPYGDCMIREWVTGVQLNRDVALTVANCVDVVAAIAQAVIEMHKVGLLHRNLKPTKILVPVENKQHDYQRSKLFDVGIMPFITEGEQSVIGTIAFMAPEQLTLGPFSAATDVFGLGATLCDLLFGEPPFFFKRRAEKVIPLPTDRRVPARLRALLACALAVNPNDRFASVGEFGAELSAARAQLRSAVMGSLRKPVHHRKTSRRIDIFISYAHEDKDTIARPLAQRLAALGLDVWFDEFSLKLGDSLREAIERGLAAARTGIVIISPTFLKKPWPKRELSALMALESRRRILLPVWHGLDASDIQRYSPLLADKFAVSTAAGLDAVVSSIIDALP